MTDLISFCEYFYNTSRIPVYLYSGGVISACFPAQASNALPPQIYRDQLLAAQFPVSYTKTTLLSSYGYIQISGTDSELIIGPVNGLPYKEYDLSKMAKEYLIDASNFVSFSSNICNIPTISLDSFLSILLFINFTLNNTKLSKVDIALRNKESVANLSTHEMYSSRNYDKKDEGIFDLKYDVETTLLRCIETGNIDELKHFTERSKTVMQRPIANNELRHTKNLCITTLILASRAAMKGGLSPSISYFLSDIYFNQIEQMTNIKDLLSLLVIIQEDFCRRTASTHISLTTDDVLRKAIDYIRANTNQNITVADVAEFTGFCYTYLSKKFKKELGFLPSDFIRRCKLEESCELLIYSDKSLSQISSFLCFSSQSHFQNAFKKQYGITPQSYRNSKWQETRLK